MRRIWVVIPAVVVGFGIGLALAGGSSSTTTGRDKMGGDKMKTSMKPLAVRDPEGRTPMNRLESKHPRAIRWMHWINVPVLGMMIWSGLMIYWANDVYDLNLGVVS